MEQKSESIENALLEIISYIIQEGDSLQIQTSSFIFNVLKFYSNDMPPALSIQNSFFTMPSFCILTNTNNCKNQIITLKVILRILEKINLKF